ncbi:MAG: ATP synthase F0 subunit B [Cyanobacteria bacterium]|nr:ATP synthase F0 subunit B [Cyanobacteriota bacterium]
MLTVSILIAEAPVTAETAETATASTLATESSASHEEAGPTGNFWLDSNVVNIAVMVVLMVILAKKFNVGAVFTERREKIAAEISSLEAQKKAAQAELDDLNHRTQNLEKEVSSILHEAQQSAESLSNNILAEAQAESQKIVENAKKRVESEQKSALQALEKRLMDDVLNDARHFLLTRLSPEDQHRSVDAFIGSLPTLKQ